MGVLFQPSAPVKSDDEQQSDHEQNNFDVVVKMAGAEDVPEPMKDLEFRNVELQPEFESIALPAAVLKQPSTDGTISEFCPQLIGILPGENDSTDYQIESIKCVFLLYQGLLVLFACGMQQSWSILQYDMAIWKQMVCYPYGVDILCIVSYYIGALIGSLIGGVLVQHIPKKFIYVRFHPFFQSKNPMIQID